jgi:hypothetical protein
LQLSLGLCASITKAEVLLLLLLLLLRFLLCRFLTYSSK